MSVLPADKLVGSIGSVRPARTAIALSPDGRLVVFVGTRGTVTQLYVRGLDHAEAKPVPGTEGASEVFFSPDGAWIGFRADNKIKKVPAAGGPPATVGDVPAGGGLGTSWGDDGTIFFASIAGISRVSAAGGTPARVTTPDTVKGERHLLPQPLPGGRAILFTTMNSVESETANVVLQSLDNAEQRVLIPGGADARYVSTGHLVYMRTGTLMAVPFDVQSRQVTGAPVALIEGVMQGLNAISGADETGAGQFTVSASGTLLYAAGGIGPIRESSMVWVDRTGVAQPLAAVPAGQYMSPRLSPDGKRIAVQVRRGASRTTDVWVHDVVRGTPTRLTFDGDNRRPIWSPDGKRLVYGASTTSANNLYAINADGGGKPERLTTSDQLQTPSSWSSANVIAFLERPGLGGGSTGIWVLPSGLRPQADAIPGISFQPDASGVLTRRALDGVRVQRVRGRRSVRAGLPWSRREDPDLDGRGNQSRSGPRPAANSSTAPRPVRARRFSPRQSAPCLRSSTTRLACCSRPGPVSTDPRRLSEAGMSAPTASGSSCCDPLNRRTSRSP